MMEQAAYDVGLVRFWNPKLQKLDDGLSLVLAQERANHPSLTPGYWHIVRQHPQATTVVLTCSWPDGSYREPGEWMVDKLKSVDNWNRRAMDEITERKRREAAAIEAAKVERRAHLVDDIQTGVKAKGNPGVNFDGSRKWTPRVKNKQK